MLHVLKILMFSCVAVKELPYGSDIELKCIAVVADS